LYGQGAPTWLAKLPSTARFELRSDHLFATGGTGVEMRRFDLRSGETSAQTKEALGDHPKAATYDHLKSGHFEGLRHTH
jgi:hypothetical protein